MVARYVREDSTSPYTWVKHLANLRNRANSQQYPSIYEDRRPKSIEDTDKIDGKGIPSGQKGHGDQGDCSPRPMLTWPAAGLPGESRVEGSLPCQTRLEQH